MPQTQQQRPVYEQWRNNTASQWWRDKSLRLCMANLLVLFLSVFALGYDGILLTGLQNVPAWQAKFHPSSSTLGLMAACYAFPNLVAPFFVQRLADKYGRRSVIIVGSVFGIAGPLCSGLGNNVASFICGRVITGCTTAFFQVSAPSLVAEVAHPRLRAPVTASLHCTYFFGSAIAGWVNFGVTSWDSQWSWRVPVILQCCGSVPVLLWAISPLMVESPRWLIFQGRETEAHQLLAKLHSNGLLEDELVMNELAEINETIQTEKMGGQASYLDFFRTRGNRKRLAVAFIFAFLSQMSGNGLAAAYLGKILAMVGLTDPLSVNAIISCLGLWLFICSTVVSQYVERFGRRGLMLWGIAGMILFFSLQTAFTAVAPSNPKVGLGAVPMIFLFMTCFAFSFMSVSYLYLTEILPYKLRTKGMALYTVIQAAWQIFGLYVTPIALAAISWKYFFVFLGCDLVAIVLVWFLIKETKGRTLEEIVEMFDDNSNHAVHDDEEKGTSEFHEDKVSEFDRDTKA